MSEQVEYKQVNPSTSYEVSDWRLAPVGWVLIGTLVLLAVTPFILMAGFPNALPDARRKLSIRPPAPVLQTNPAEELKKFRASEEKRLNGYSWIDRSKGIVRIPIEEAMRKLVAAGYAGFPKAAP